jgi:hypothetical protein
MTDSSTGLLRPNLELPSKARTETVIRKPIIKLPSTFGAKSDTRLNAPAAVKGKAKTVHYPDSPELSFDTPSMPSTPAPPNEVLRRTGSQVEGTSAGAVARAIAHEENDVEGDVIMRGKLP